MEQLTVDLEENRSQNTQAENDQQLMMHTLISLMTESDQLDGQIDLLT